MIHHHGTGFDGFAKLRCYPLRPSARRRRFGMRGCIDERRLSFFDDEA
jgi:hypothetical protein